MAVPVRIRPEHYAQPRRIAFPDDGPGQGARLQNRCRRTPPGELDAAVQVGLVGCSGYLINLAIFVSLADNLGLHHLVAATIAVALAMPFNFLGNKLWAFA